MSTGKPGSSDSSFPSVLGDNGAIELAGEPEQVGLAALRLEGIHVGGSVLLGPGDRDRCLPGVAIEAYLDQRVGDRAIIGKGAAQRRERHALCLCRAR